MTLTKTRIFAMYAVNFAARLTTMQPTGMKMSSLLSALAPNEVKNLKAEIEKLKASKWISVKNRLPKSACAVLVVNYTDVLEADYSTAGDAFTEPRQCQSCEGKKLRDVTHWQPLPAPPKEQGE